jgi:hypothetical protein
MPCSPRYITSALHAAIFAVILAPGIAGPQMAQAFVPSQDLPVLQLPDSRAFEVVQQHAAGPRQVWCAAGEHARDVLRLPTATRLYIARGRAASDLANGRITIRFSPDPVAPTGPQQDSPYTVSLRDVGFSLSIGHALSYCNDRIDDIFDRF